MTFTEELLTTEEVELVKLIHATPALLDALCAWLQGDHEPLFRLCASKPSTLCEHLHGLTEVATPEGND